MEEAQGRREAVKDVQNPRKFPAGESKTNGDNQFRDGTPDIVVIMGPTGAGKSKLAVDLASHFPIEIINADSMQVYKGLDVLTNKIPLQDQNGVPHHLLGTISPNVEFTSKDFCHSAINLIDEIWSRNHLPVVVGGTNYYIQALVSPFLLDDSAEDTEANCITDVSEEMEPEDNHYGYGERSYYTYDHLKDVDPVSANRIHPNDNRKINQYLNLYERFGIIPSKLLQEKSMENWGRVDDSRFRCCFICVDASLPVLDLYVNQRVDNMLDRGLLDEVFTIYKSNADYTRGLRQAIGVREFEDFLRHFVNETSDKLEDPHLLLPGNGILKEKMQDIVDATCQNHQKVLLTEAIGKMKLNTRRLVRRQKRRLSRLQLLFGWDINFIDATVAISSVCDDLWTAQVLEPSVNIIKSFLGGYLCSEHLRSGPEEMKCISRDLWTQFVCEACGNKVLRGSHEWEQHKQGRSHRKRISRLKKLQIYKNSEGHKWLCTDESEKGVQL